MGLTAGVTRAVLRRVDPAPAADASPEHLREHADRRLRRLPRPRGAIYQRASLGGVPAVRAAHWRADADRSVLLLHGGAFVQGSARGHAGFAGRLAKASQGITYALDYRLAPEHPHPAAVTDAVAALRALAERTSGGRVALVADTAGGGVALSALHALRDGGGPAPRCAVLISPWLDLTLSGESVSERAAVDLGPSAEWFAAMAERYAPGARAEPGPSPLFGDQSALPPLLLMAGGDEILRNDAERLAARARGAGGDVTLEIFAGMWHGWHLLAPVLPEARRAVAAAGAFVRSRA